MTSEREKALLKVLAEYHGTCSVQAPAQMMAKCEELGIVSRAYLATLEPKPDDVELGPRG